jgi:replicative superfamily II helicase
LLKALFCTTTLAAGVNLPAARVIIVNLKVGAGELLSSITYKQMVGRAGRYGQSTHADSILIASDRN